MWRGSRGVSSRTREQARRHLRGGGADRHRRTRTDYPLLCRCCTDPTSSPRLPSFAPAFSLASPSPLCPKYQQKQKKVKSRRRRRTGWICLTSTRRSCRVSLHRLRNAQANNNAFADAVKRMVDAYRFSKDSFVVDEAAKVSSAQLCRPCRRLADVAPATARATRHRSRRAGCTSLQSEFNAERRCSSASGRRHRVDAAHSTAATSSRARSDSVVRGTFRSQR